MNDFKAPAILPQHGFGEFEVPEMPAYTQSYSKRGNTFDGATTAVKNQARFGNKTGKGGMGAYLSQVEDPTFFDGFREKLGNHGVFENIRWAPGQDWRGGFGIASLDSSKNYAMSTRGGMLRKGGPKRSDVIDRPNYWFETARPGISYGRYTQNNQNYSGLYEWKRRTPIVEANSDALVLREMIEHNPFSINSHSAQMAKRIYDKEFTERDRDVAAYNMNVPLSQNHTALPSKNYDHSIQFNQGPIVNDNKLVYNPPLP